MIGPETVIFSAITLALVFVLGGAFLAWTSTGRGRTARNVHR